MTTNLKTFSEARRGFTQPIEVVVYYANSESTFVQDALTILGWSFSGYDGTQIAVF